MSPEVIKQQVDAAPFRPFRVHMSDGSTYDVQFRDHVMVGRRDLVIGLHPDSEGWPRHSVILDPLHVTRIEPLRNGDPSEAA